MRGRRERASSSRKMKRRRMRTRTRTSAALLFSARSGVPDAPSDGSDARPGVPEAGSQTCRELSAALPLPARPGVPGLQPYCSHAVAFIGRSLRCLNCFQAPGRNFRSWRRGRCDGARAPAEMPAELKHALARQPVADPQLDSRIRDRWMELVVAGAVAECTDAAAQPAVAAAIAPMQLPNRQAGAGDPPFG